MQRKIISWFVFASIIGGLFFVSCRKDKFYTGTANLNFSTDTLTFDTVFTTIGSTTQYFKIYNPYSKKVRINRIHLQNGSGSLFRLNVDGKAGNDQSNIDIAAHDSIYIFVAVTIDPTNKNNPIVVYDKVLVESNESQSGVVLQAWGQDVYIHRNHGYFKNKTDSLSPRFDTIIINFSLSSPSPIIKSNVSGNFFLISMKLSIKSFQPFTSLMRPK